MATQGLVSIVRDGKVQFKAIAGCNGMQSPTLAAAIRESPPETIDELALLCCGASFGCCDCTVIQGEAGVITSAKDELGPLYAEKFSDPRFNPRWYLGTADYVEVVELKGGA
jgi:hypothetical protein